MSKEMSLPATQNRVAGNDILLIESLFMRGAITTLSVKSKFCG